MYFGGKTRTQESREFREETKAGPFDSAEERFAHDDRFGIG
jgi:hypothetical protein